MPVNVDKNASFRAVWNIVIRESFTSGSVLMGIWAAAQTLGWQRICQWAFEFALSRQRRKFRSLAEFRTLVEEPRVRTILSSDPRFELT
jgi:hypothetical protein